MEITDVFSELLLDWYSQHRRDLPWRGGQDPYKIWISEVILQQTQVCQGMPYYRRFLERYPSVSALARSTSEDVLRLWEGLGYYKRAHQLHRCAQLLERDYGGQFPSSYQELCRLPGIGPYTAAAIASMAFRQVVPAIDGNVNRVITRVFGVMCDISKSAGRKLVSQIAYQIIDRKSPDLFNHAMMDFGALCCRSRAPLCKTCVFQKYCVAYAKHTQYLLPVKGQKAKKRTRYFHYYIIQYQDRFYLKIRDQKDIWLGLYDFYLIECDQAMSLNHVRDELLDMVGRYHVPVVDLKIRDIHQLTHQTLVVHFHKIIINNDVKPVMDDFLEKKSLRPFTLQEVVGLPKSIVMQRIIQRLTL